MKNSQAEADLRRFRQSCNHVVSSLNAVATMLLRYKRLEPDQMHVCTQILAFQQWWGEFSTIASLKSAPLSAYFHVKVRLSFICMYLIVQECAVSDVPRHSSHLRLRCSDGGLQERLEEFGFASLFQLNICYQDPGFPMARVAAASFSHSWWRFEATRPRKHNWSHHGLLHSPLLLGKWFKQDHVCVDVELYVT